MIRRIDRLEIEKCVEVIKKSFLTVAQEYGFTEENAPRFTAFATTAERLSFQYDEGRPMYGYFDESGQISGYYSLHIQENKECELNNLCVLPEYRHRHIGEALFCHALTTASDRGCNKMNIGIVEENKKLRTWYEKLGAKHIGTKKFDFFPFTCGYMEKDIFKDNMDKKQNIELWDAYYKDGALAGCDFQKEYDCCFTRNQYYFRYRAAAIIIEDGAVLMARNDIDDYYYSIGGGVHLGETSEQAVIREVFEETGVHYEVDRLAFVNECLFYGKGSLEGKECHGIELYYLMKPRGTRELGSSNAGVGMMGQKEYMCWLPIDKLSEYKEFPAFFREKLINLGKEIEHIVSDERAVNSEGEK